MSATAPQILEIIHRTGTGAYHHRHGTRALGPLDLRSLGYIYREWKDSICNGQEEIV